MDLKAETAYILDKVFEGGHSYAYGVEALLERIFKILHELLVVRLIPPHVITHSHLLSCSDLF